MKLTEFVLAGCPYCRMAEELLRELYAERPEFAKIEIEVIDESLDSALADTYDYYRVPSFFSGREKLYEANPLWPRSEVRKRLVKMLDSVLEAG